MTKLDVQKKLAAKITKVGKRRVKVDSESAEEIKAAITKADIASLISEGKIKIINKRGVSRHRARKIHLQKKKGKRRGFGKRKGTANARNPKKKSWMSKIRLQRKTLLELKENGKISKKDYRMLYLRSKGGFFRSKKHLLLYAKQHNLIKK